MNEREFLNGRIFVDVNTNYRKWKQFIIGTTITKDEQQFEDGYYQNEYCFNVWLGLIGLHIGFRGRRKKRCNGCSQWIN